MAEPASPSQQPENASKQQDLRSVRYRSRADSLNQSVDESLLHLHKTTTRLLAVLVGLPGRGKTYIGKKICRYLNWIGYDCRAVNIGNYRRQVASSATHEYFAPDNATATKERQEACKRALADTMQFFSDGGQAAVLDGTNTTRSRREYIIDYVRAQEAKLNINIKVLWVESICTDAEMLEANIKNKLNNPDYKGMESEAALVDFRKRIKQYEKVYCTVDADSFTSEPERRPSEFSMEDQQVPEERKRTQSTNTNNHSSTQHDESTYSYVKIFNAGERTVTNNIQGYLASRLVFFLLNIRIQRHTLYFSRHGESLFNINDRIGGDPALSDHGTLYRQVFSDFMTREIKTLCQDKENKTIGVWTSTMKRAASTGEIFLDSLRDSGINVVHHSYKSLAEIDVGICDSLTYDEVEVQYPGEFAARAADKLRYRYPQGESYLDVINRIEPIIFELERADCPIVVVSHRAVLRCLIAYFSDVPPAQIPYVAIPLHTVMKLEPRPYGCDITLRPLSLDGNNDNPPVQDFTWEADVPVTE